MLYHWPYLNLEISARKTEEVLPGLYKLFTENGVFIVQKRRKPKKHLTQIRQVSGTMFFFLHHREKGRVRFTRENQIAQF